MEMKKMFEARMEPLEKIKAFKKLVTQFKPCMHKFFAENFNHPLDWHSKVLAYSKSLASTSIVGYIIGLGDRHLSNVMIDTQTAKIVHVDLNMIFDQAKLLPVPELVPFRLTPDMVDGLGVFGVEGIFRKNCERVLEIMKKHSDDLVVVIDSFKYDPLYKWEANPLKAKVIEQTERVFSDFVGKNDAEISISRLREKLKDRLTVRGRVSGLINEAMSAENLALMYYGWQAWV